MSKQRPFLALHPRHSFWNWMDEEGGKKAALEKREKERERDAKVKPALQYVVPIALSLSLPQCV